MTVRLSATELSCNEYGQVVQTRPPRQSLQAVQWQPNGGDALQLERLLQEVMATYCQIYDSSLTGGLFKDLN